jgi:hypothetical protein
MEANKTAIPWMYAQGDNDDAMIVNREGDKSVCPHIKLEDAALIVRAVNAHSDLVEALKAAEEADEERQSFGELEKAFRDRGCAMPDGSDYEYYRRSRQRNLIAKAGA